MALRHEPFNAEKRRRPRGSKKETAFRTHLAVYLCVGLFLFTLNLLTLPSSFELWFYWPLFFWGWGLVFHALATYGAEAPARVPEVLRSLVPWVGDALPVSQRDAKPGADAAPFAAEAFAAVHARVERLNELAWHIPDESVRERAVRFCESADQLTATMAADRAAEETVSAFDEELLAPAVSLLERYVSAVSHDSPEADDEARRIAEYDLPLLQSRLDALSDEWRRGDGVDVSVAVAAPAAAPSAPHGTPLRSHP